MILTLDDLDAACVWWDFPDDYGQTDTATVLRIAHGGADSARHCAALERSMPGGGDVDLLGELDRLAAP